VPSRLRREVGVAAALAATVAATGAVVGAVWVWTTPRAQAVVGDGGVFLADPEGQAAIATDGRFALLGAGAGLCCGLLAFVVLRHRGVSAAVGLAAGGVAASVLAWRLGTWLGPEAVSVAAKGAAAGTRLDLPLELRATGVLLAWPLLAVASYLVLTAALVREDPPGAWASAPADRPADPPSGGPAGAVGPAAAGGPSTP
jgi:hypothetical protein